METQRLISDVLGGKPRTLSFDDLAVGPENTTACALSALNFTRLAFAAEGITPTLSKILTSLCSKKTAENALSICREWHSGITLEVEDVYRIPLFEASLRLVSTDYDLPSADHVMRLLENLQTLSSSAAILISRCQDVVVCLRLRTTGQEIFVLFHPRVASEDRVASLTFSTSLLPVVQRLCDVFPADNVHLAQGNRDRQAGMLDKCTKHVFVPRAAAYDPSMGEDSLLVSSLTLLALKAELEELTFNTDVLKKDKQQLEKSIIDLRAQLLLNRAKTKSSQMQAPKPPVAKTSSRRIPVVWNSQLGRPSYPGRERETLVENVDEMDPGMRYALQLQATFDSENDFLLQQKYDLMQTAQRQYHCGVCLDDFPEDDAVRIDACGHEICRDCARGHVCTKIEEHRFPVLCPVCMADAKKKHPGTIPSALVQLLGVSEKQWETWVEMELAQFSIPFTCRKCHHSAFVDKQDLEASPEIHCPFPACDHVWCKKCQQTIVPNGPKHSCDGTSELDHLMRQQGWRYCPNCKTPIQKSHGCNHLLCIAPGCNTHFCYRCGKTINQTAIPREIQEGKTAHFRSCALF